MPETYRIEIEEELNSDRETILLEGINATATHMPAMHRVRPFGIFVEDAHKLVKGGLTGFTYYGCLYIDMLWVETSLRSQGWGSQLMAAAENLARKRECRFATVNTMSWEALPFYQKLGYQIEFTREGYLNQAKKFMLRKTLTL